MGLPESPKDRGHLAELMFAVELKRRGHTVLTTGGDNAAFDVVVYNVKGKFFKVQIKSCLHEEPGRKRHIFTIKRGGAMKNRAYSPEDVDVVALYAFDINEWYILPIAMLENKKTIKIDAADIYGQYKDHWSIFE